MPRLLRARLDRLDGQSKRPRRHVRFIAALTAVLDGGEYPSAGRICTELGVGGANLSGEQCRWRREHLESMGWTAPVKGRGRWVPPEGGG